jgi:hypothetical protein
LHAPQCSGSLLRSTHDAPPHKVCPALQPVTQLEPLHAGVVLPHCASQAPQCAGFVFAASHPGVPSQFKKSPVQAQVPCVHVVFAPQSFVQAPHVFGSPSDASQPSSGLPLQSA